MVKELLYELYSLYRQYTGEGVILSLFIVSAAVLAAYGRGRERYVLLSPLAAIGSGISFIMERVWKLSRGPAGYAAVFFAAAVCVLAVTSSGANILSPDMNTVSENELHIPEQLAEAMDESLAQVKSPVVLTMPEWAIYFESYSSKFALLRDLSVYEELTKHSPDMKLIAKAAHEGDCDILVLSKDMWPAVPVTKYGYELIYETDMCSVYKEVRTP